MKKNGISLEVEFLGKKFENPFILAAAPPSDDLEMVRNAFKAGWAGAVLKTTSVEDNPVHLKYPMMSTFDFQEKKVAGLGNIDLISEHHIDIVEKRVKILKEEFPEKIVIASIMGSQKEEWQSLVIRLKKAGADMIECSFSCPQGSLGQRPGAMLAQDTELVETVTGWVKEAAGDMPVMIKITPVVTHITDTAEAVKRGGGDAVTASNTIPALMGIDLDNFIPFPNVNGLSSYSGYSGNAIKPISLKIVSDISKNVGIPISGTGGIETWRDGVEFMLVGAVTLQLATVVMHYGFRVIDNLKSGLYHFLQEKNMKSPMDLIGKSLKYIVSHDELDKSYEPKAEFDKEKCIKCGLCYIACRDGGHMAVERDEDRFPVFDKEKCVGCSMCKLVCPVECIELKAEAN